MEGAGPGGSSGGSAGKGGIERSSYSSWSSGNPRVRHFLSFIPCPSLTFLRVIDNLANTMQEFIEGLAILTSGNVSIIWAGPEPVKGGQVNVVS